MNIAACVILYHPNEEDLQNISTYLSKVDMLYVYDNTENKTVKYFFDENNSKIIYFSDLENRGLSIRLNQACNQAISDGFNFLLTMDQDSSFIEGNLDQYFNDIKNYPKKETVGIFNLEYHDKNKTVNSANIIPEEVHTLITSASVINLTNFDKIGGFDENLFIDGVDFDYCLATIKNGFKCINFKNNFFKHVIGKKIKKGSFKTLYLIKKEKYLHSPIRLYYMIRNILYLEKKYALIFPEYISEIKKKYNTQIQTNLNYSPNIFTFYKYKFKALSDFKNNRMGKFQDFDKTFTNTNTNN
jgi:rhamnosyltransferase